MPPTRLLSAAAAGTTRCATCVRSTRCLVARLGQTEGGDGIVELGVSAGEPVRHVLAAKVGLLTLRRQGPAGPGRAIGRLPLAAQRVEAALRGLAATADTHRVVLPDRDVLAELTACAPETVSRAIAALVRAGRLQRGERRNIVVLPPVGADAAQPMPDGGLPVARQDTRAADDAINRRFA